MTKKNLATQLWRAWRLRCPVCGQGKLFKGFFKMRDICESCGIKYEREGGFFLGSIYFNYGLTSIITAIIYPFLLINRVFPERTLLGMAAVFVVLFPMWFFRYARSFWLGFDQYVDPRNEEPSNTRKSTDIDQAEPAQKAK